MLHIQCETHIDLLNIDQRCPTGCPKVLVTKGQTHTDLFTLDHNLSKRTCFKQSNAPRFVYTPSTGVSRCFIYSVIRPLICVTSITRCPKVLVTKGQTHIDLFANAWFKEQAFHEHPQPELEPGSPASKSDVLTSQTKGEGGGRDTSMTRCPTVVDFRRLSTPHQQVSQGASYIV